MKLNFKPNLSLVFLLFLGTSFSAISQVYKMQPVTIQSRWAKEVSATNVLPEYPRPQMVRKNWTNLNGLWDYAITAKDAAKPSSFEGQILVPYPLESALSGVKKALLPEQHLWYKRNFSVDQLNNDKLLLNFGAVDWQATVYVNGKEVGQHTGGYTAFSIDISAAVKAGQNELVVKVYDPSDRGIGPHGKQVLKPENIYYTPSSGIWQTVWLEKVPQTYISALQLTPNIDKGVLTVNVSAAENVSLEITALDGSTVISTVKGKPGVALQLPVKNAKLWSPATPFLYDLSVKLVKGGKVVDEVKSYFGMRKIYVAKDSKGVDRIFLNNKAYFNLGTLDQGFWPEGLYTAPTDEALAFDIKASKAMGFNTIRKHIKVEPARWYYHADKLGMLVWQDFVNPHQALPEGSKPVYEKQVQETFEQLHNYPSITTWVIFNEKWGAYDQQRLTEWVKRSDPSRIVNGHSGEYLYVNEQLRSPSPNAYVSADMTDVHSYPDPMNALKMPGKAQVLGEFGGIGVFIPNHQWNVGSAWGYIQEKPAALKAKYTIMNQHLKLLEAEGLSASIYTQPFDVEGEQNGLITYDREVVKIPFAELRKIHASLNPEMGTIPSVTAQDADLTEPAQLYSNLLQKYIDGERGADFLKTLAMYASQAGDKGGTARITSEYISSLKPPYSADQYEFIVQNTKSVNGPGYALLQQQLAGNDASINKREVTVKMMNIIFQDLIAPHVPTPEAKPDWDKIRESLKSYGAPAEEMFLRAKTIHLLNQQDMEGFRPVAKEYLAKYGAFIKPEEKKAFEDNLTKEEE